MGTFLVKWDSFEHSNAPKHQNGNRHFFASYSRANGNSSKWEYSWNFLYFVTTGAFLIDTPPLKSPKSGEFTYLIYSGDFEHFLPQYHLLGNFGAPKLLKIERFLKGPPFEIQKNSRCARQIIYCGIFAPQISVNHLLRKIWDMNLTDFIY